MRSSKLVWNSNKFSCSISSNSSRLLVWNLIADRQCFPSCLIRIFRLKNYLLRIFKKSTIPNTTFPFKICIYSTNNLAITRNHLWKSFPSAHTSRLLHCLALSMKKRHQKLKKWFPLNAHRPNCRLPRPLWNNILNRSNKTNKIKNRPMNKIKVASSSFNPSRLLKCARSKLPLRNFKSNAMKYVENSSTTSAISQISA